VLAFASPEVLAQGEVIHYDSGYTWRGYTGTTPPTCASKLCHRHPLYSFDIYYKEFTAWRSHNNDPNSARIFLNFRVLFPPGYNVKNQAKTYPLVIMLHGSGESGRVWTDQFNYEPTDPMYDNNSHQLKYGGSEHRAASVKPVTDPTSCQAIVVFPQASYSGNWSDLAKPEVSEYEEILLAFVEKQMIAKYHADRNRVIMHGISNGGREVWALATKRPDLFAGIMPMSAVPTNVEQAADSLWTTPIWIFQGGLDTNPTPRASETVVKVFESRGGTPKRTVYPDAGHETWSRAYKEPVFFSWIMSQDKRNIFVQGGNTQVCEPVHLGLSAGMKEYQWFRNGVQFSNATRYITVNAPGKYTARFMRPDGEWVDSFPLTLTRKSDCVVAAVDPSDPSGESKVFPNPTRSMVTVLAGSEVDVDEVVIFSVTGQQVIVPIESIDQLTFTADMTSLSPGLYVIRLTRSGKSFVVVRE
jgi:predicted esterase